jgi:hypothetical protein
LCIALALSVFAALACSTGSMSSASTNACTAAGGRCPGEYFCDKGEHGGGDVGCATGICCLPGAIENTCAEQGGTCVGTNCPSGYRSTGQNMGCSDPAQEGTAVTCCLPSPTSSDAGADADSADSSDGDLDALDAAMEGG